MDQFKIIDEELMHISSLDAIQKERRLLRALIDNLPDYIFVKDTKSRFVLNNSAHLHMLGAKVQEDVIGKTDFDTFPQELAEKYYADEKGIMTSGVPLVDFEEMTLTADGQEKWLSATKVPLFDDSGTIIGLVGICRDITARKLAEQKLQVMAQELARSNAELEQFAYVASHDLQEPLRAITGYIQLLERRYADKLGDDATNFMHRSIAAAGRMKRLIEDLLAYSRVGRRDASFTLANCSLIVQDTINSLDVIIKESDAVVQFGALPTLWADPTQLRQLFQNLISNAIKFRSEKRPEIHIDATRQGSLWLFAVRDNGIGIEADYAERIFLIFQRLHTRTDYPGTGIGLAICKKIVEHHGGNIWIESELTKGTTFFFTLSTGTFLHG